MLIFECVPVSRHRSSKKEIGWLTRLEEHIYVETHMYHIDAYVSTIHIEADNMKSGKEKGGEQGGRCC